MCFPHLRTLACWSGYMRFSVDWRAPQFLPALFLVCVRLLHIASKNGRGCRYMDMDRLRRQAD